MRRSSLVLLNSLVRSSLRLLGEADVALRELERQAITGGPHERKAYFRRRKRAGLPRGDFHWRWNGKGWYTRPQWNNGQCPPETEPTRNNTCIHPNDQDIHHYRTDDPPTGGSADFQRLFKKIARIRRTPEVEDSPITLRAGSKVNWDHPHGPMIYVPYDNDVKPRPLPENPEHLPLGLQTGLGNHRGNWVQRRDYEEKKKLHDYYVSKGYDSDYVKKALQSREDITPTGDLTDADLERLPKDRLSRFRALRRKAKADERRSRADWELWRQDSINQFGEDPGPFGSRRRRYDDYDDYDDYFDRDYDYDYDLVDYPYEPPIGGYENHPGYPGHPDYPEFDGRSAEQPATTRGSDDYEDEPDSYGGVPSYRWDRRGRPPRTGERPDVRGDIEDEFDVPRSGRGRGSSRRSRRSPGGGGRGRTNFRGRGGRRTTGGRRESGY